MFHFDRLSRENIGKLTSLIRNSQNLFYTVYNNILHTGDNWFSNLTELQIPNTIKVIMALGLKFSNSIFDKNKCKKCLIELISSFESNFVKLDSDDFFLDTYKKIKFEFTHLLHNLKNYNNHNTTSSIKLDIFYIKLYQYISKTKVFNKKQFTSHTFKSRQR